MQKADDDNHQKRVRYITSCVTANITEPGSKFKEVPDVIGIYISKFDMFDSGKTVYHIDRVIRETGEVVENGLQEIYVNAKVDDGSDVAELMHIFTETDAYDFEKFPKVSGRKKQFKQSEGGQGTMCDLVENYARECAAEAVKEATKQVTEQMEREAATATENNARRFFKNGGSYELVRNSIPSLSDETLQRIYDEVQKGK